MDEVDTWQNGTNHIILRDKGVLILPCGRYGNVLRLIPLLVIIKGHINKAEVEGDILEAK